MAHTQSLWLIPIVSLPFLGGMSLRTHHLWSRWQVTGTLRFLVHYAWVCSIAQGGGAPGWWNTGNTCLRQVRVTTVLMIPLTKPQRSRSLLKLKIMKQTFYSVLASFICGKPVCCQSLLRDCQHSHMHWDWHSYCSYTDHELCGITTPDIFARRLEKWKVISRINIPSCAQSPLVKHLKVTFKAALVSCMPSPSDKLSRPHHSLTH